MRNLVRGFTFVLISIFVFGCQAPTDPEPKPPAEATVSLSMAIPAIPADMINSVEVSLKTAAGEVKAPVQTGFTPVNFKGLKPGSCEIVVKASGTVNAETHVYFSGVLTFNLAEGANSQTITLNQIKATSVDADIKNPTIQKGQVIKLTTATPGANIFYTLDGTAPTEKSLNYAETPVVMNTEGSGIILIAKAFAPGMAASVPLTLVFNVRNDQILAPSISPVSGSYENAVQVTLTHPVAGSKIYFTTDGTDPKVAPAQLYSTPFSLNNPGTFSVKAIAENGGKVSTIATTTYVISNPQPIQNVVLSPVPGTVYVDTPINLTCATSGVSIYYTTDGSDPLTSITKKLYQNAFNFGVKGQAVLKAIAVKDTGTSAITSGLYNVIEHTSKVDNPVIMPLSTAIFNTDTISISTTTVGADIYYTTNNSTPSASNGTLYKGAFSLGVGNGQVVKAVALKSGLTDSDVISHNFDVAQNNNPFQVATPIINPGLVSVTKAQPIEINCATPDAKIYYTLDGSTPSASSTAYTKAFTLNVGTVTLKAIAIKSGYSDSALNSRTFEVSAGYVGGIKVYAMGYNNVYFWKLIPTATGPAWPGNPLVSEGKWKSYEFPGVTSLSLIFNNPGQTADLTRDAQGAWWYYNGTWYAYDPLPPGTPVIKASPEGGKFAETLTVVLTSSETDDQIYYTTNGSTPTLQSSVAPATGIQISQPTVIKAMGKNRLGITGPVAEFSFDVNPNYDLVSPSVGAVKKTGNWRASSLDVSFTLKDNKSALAKAYYTTDGSEPTISSPVYVSGDATNTLTGPSITISGKKTFKFLAVDAAGNTSAATFTYNVDPDVRVDFREETIYFLMTTRFYDGDPANNFNCWDEAAISNPVTDPGWRGDFKGLIEKLDYIKALGFSAIWITPPVKNMSGLDYHGYHAVDFKEIDPRYKSAEDANANESYQKLINAAHDKGIKVIQDIVLNHSSNFGEENLYPLFEKDASGFNGGYKNKTVAANLIPNAALNAAADRLAAQQGKTREYIFANQPYQARLEATKTVAGDPNWLYKHGNQTNWNSWSQQDGDMAGDCRELNTENYTTAKYLMEAYDQYINMGVDAFRIDTVKHISRTTFNNFFLPHFKQTGGDGFYMFGECANIYSSVWDNGIPAQSTPHYTWKESKTYPWSFNPTEWAINQQTTKDHWTDNLTMGGQPTSLNHLLDGNNYRPVDYSKSSGLSMIDFCMHHNFANAGAAFDIKKYDDTYNDATWNVVYVDSHDYGPNNDGGLYMRYTGGEGSLAENMSLMFTFRGIPTIYYGTEIQFQKGKQIEPWGNGRVPFAESGRAYFGDKITGNVSTTDFGKYSASGNVAGSLGHNVAQHIRRLNLIRRAVPALQKGQYSTSDVAGGIAFKRRYTDAVTDSFALVAISGTATFSNLPAGTYVDAVTGDSKTVSAGGSLTATVSGQANLRVYVLNTAKTPAPGKVGEDAAYQGAAVKYMN